MNDEMSSLQQVRTEYEVAKYASTCVALVEGLTAAQIPATRRKRRVAGIGRDSLVLHESLKSHFELLILRLGTQALLQ
jgi:hypothetical protein